MDKEISVIHLILVFVDKLDDRFVIFENSFLAVLAIGYQPVTKFCAIQDHIYISFIRTRNILYIKLTCTITSASNSSHVGGVAAARGDLDRW